MARYPALDVSGVDPDLALAAADPFAPTAAEPHPGGITIFFPDPARRDAAHAAVAAELPGATLAVREVDDEDWARRSQQNLPPVTVGRITIVPIFSDPPGPPDLPALPAPPALQVRIRPSMGFGTGHHATTRLSLAGLQEVDLSGRTVLDVGTGSGVLALAARRLGAARAIGIDYDADAIQNAQENLALNPDLSAVTFHLADFSENESSEPGGGAADVLVANLTGALLARSAGRLMEAVQPGGAIIVSGLLATERDEVIRAFGGSPGPDWEAREDEWIALRFRQP